MSLPLTDQVALITGASQGIGRALAHALAAEGVHLVLTARNEQKLNELTLELRETAPEIKIRIVPADVQDAVQVQHVVDEALKAFDRLDILINNAGISGKISLLQEISVDEIDRTLDTNLKGPIYFMRAVLPTMVHQQSGVIININFVAGKTAFPYWSIYDASKFGLHAITEAVAEEQRSNGIKVVGIYPGAVDTPIWNGIELDHEPKRDGMLDAESVAEAVLYVLKQPKKSFVKDITLTPLQPAL